LGYSSKHVTSQKGIDDDEFLDLTRTSMPKISIKIVQNETQYKEIVET
jgi:hypothetical protein